MRILLRICNASMAAQLPEIWRTVAPLKMYRARSTMKSACRCTANSLRFRPPHIPHVVAVMVMALAFHTKYPDGVEDKLSIFFFPKLFPLGG